MRRCSTVLALTLAAVCWLAAGPGFVGLEAALLCHYHEHHMSHDGPCFCAQMGGALDATAPDALAHAPAPVAITVERLVQITTDPCKRPTAGSFNGTISSPGAAGG